MWNDLPEPLEDEQLKILRQAIQPVNPWQTFVSCVDGRALEKDGDFVQKLGGELQTLLWILFLEWRNGNQMTFREAFETNNALHQDAHLRIGIHTGPHADANRTDCGFADNLLSIVRNLAEHGEEIRKLLNHGANSNGIDSVINDSNTEDWADIVQLADEITSKAESDPNYAFISGPEMFSTERQIAGEYAETHLVGEHKEQFAHLNLAPMNSINVRMLNEQGTPGFNLDLWYALDVVGETQYFTSRKASKEFLKLLTLGLYQATERTLRPEKPPLPIVITTESELVSPS